MREYIKETVRWYKVKTVGLREFLKKNEIFLKILSTLIISGVLAIWGLKLNATNVEINKKNAEINEKQLKILENDKKPYFNLTCKAVQKKTEETKGTDKIAVRRYTVTNVGGRISVIMANAESYIFFLIPTDVEGEFHIFKYMTHNFDINYNFPQRKKEGGNKFIFYEYEQETNKNFKNEMALLKYVMKCFSGNMYYTSKDILQILYIDYMGEECNELLEFDGFGIQKLQGGKIEGVSVGYSTDIIKNGKKVGNMIAPPLDSDNIKEVGDLIKKDIEDWLAENGNTRGHEVHGVSWINPD